MASRVTSKSKKKYDPKKELSGIAEDIKTRNESVKGEMFEIGRLLCKAKDMLPKGDFKPWVKSNFDFSYQTANNFMNVYRYCLRDKSIVSSVSSSVLYLIASKKFPSDLREYLFENADYLKGISNKDMRKVYKKFKAGKIDLESPEVKALLKFKKGDKSNRDYQRRIRKCIKWIEKLEQAVVMITEKIQWPERPGTERTELTENYKKRIDELIHGIVATIKEAKPKATIVDTVKPEFKISRS